MCVAVEDSATGVQAALAAGAITFAIDPTGLLPRHLIGHERLVRTTSLDLVRQIAFEWAARE
jgi:beta-phosphoglucomutase-like phosphatase (HAD superfamily)